MNIRAITVERGIATLAQQSRLSTQLLFSSTHASRDSHDAGARGISAGTVDAVSSPTGDPSRQEGEELEGGYYDDEDNDVWFEEQDEDEEEDDIREEDRNMTRSTNGDDVEKANVY